jgi:translocation and assembly module TamA
VKFAAAAGGLLLLFFVVAGWAHAAEPLRLQLAGLEGAVRANVEAALALPPGLVRDGQIDRRWMERYMAQIPQQVALAMQPFGYFTPQVESHLEEAADGQLIKVNISPGEPVRVTKRRVAVVGPGSARGALTRLADSFPLKVGDPLDQAVYEEFKKELLDKALELGYLDAAFSVHEIRVDVAALATEIALEMDTGPRYYFGEGRFVGAQDYPEAFLRRFLTFEPGDIFSHASLGETQLQLLDSDRFSDIRLVADRENAKDRRIPVNVLLEPSPSRRLRPGIGYGTDTGARMSLLYRDLNIFNRGHELNLKANLAQKAQTVGASYVWPDAESLNSFTALRLTYEREDADTFLSSKLGVEAERMWDLKNGRKFSTYLQIFHEDYTVGEASDGMRMVLPGARFSHRHYRSLIRPKNGYHYSIEVRGGHPYLGSDIGLLQFMASGNILLGLPGQLSLLSRINAGWSLQNEPLEKIPASLRFFAGGDQSVRGYAYQSLGPRDDNGDVVGGEYLLVGSLELERALGEKWGLAVFYDVGNAFDDPGHIRLAQGAGLGVRYYTPVGPVRLDIARQVGEDDPSCRIHLSIGYGW